MEKHEINSAIRTLQILRNKISIKLLKVIEKEGSLTGLELQEKTFLPQSSCSEFLNKLKRTGVLTREKKGRKVYFSFNKARYDQIERVVRDIG